MNSSNSKYTNKDVAHKFDNQSRLGYAISGKRGGNPQVKDDVGKISVFIDNSMGCHISGGDYITVDAFHGHGDTYCRREKCEIIIIKSGNEVFKGNFDDLISKLNTQEKTYKIEPITE